jgi:hypothetical protein
MENYTTDIKILQQSQSKLVLDYLLAQGVIPTPQELWHCTEIFVECCLHPRDKELNKRLKEMNNWIIEQKQKK